MMSDFPEDLVEEILCRLPATSLKRLRSTCKLWNNLFSDSRFTRKHIDKAAKQFLVLMLKNYKVWSMSVNLHGNPSIEVICERCLVDPCSLDQDELEFTNVFHCDGLLLCTEEIVNKIVVWNPLTGETKWIQPKDGDMTCNYSYTLGSYQDKKSGNKSYKILSCGYDNNTSKIYEINSNSWRTLDDATPAPNCDLAWVICLNCRVSLNGKTYWIASEKMEEHVDRFLLRFNYTTESFESLKGQFPSGMDGEQTRVLSVVREEKLATLLKPKHTSRIEIWLTNKIDETKKVSWSKVLALDLSPDVKTEISDGDGSFLFDEEKKVLVFCNERKWKNMVYIVGEDNRVTQVPLGVSYDWPFLFYYFPRLTQIQ